MTAIRVTESSGSVGILQISDGTGGFSPSNILFHTASSGIAESVLLGSDVAVFVSGATDSRGTSRAGSALFGGDVVISGTLYGGSPLKLGGEVEFVTSDGATTDLKNPSGSVKMFGRDEVKIGSGDGLVRLIDLGGSTAGKIFLTGSSTNTDRRLKFLSKGQIHFHGKDPNAESPGSNVFLFVSGAIDAHKTLKRGVALFGGDVVVSGTLYAEKQVVEVDEVATGDLIVSGTILTESGISGSITRLPDGTSYMSAGSDITVASSSAGQITVTSTAQDQRKKFLYEVTGSHQSSGRLEVPSVNFSNVGYNTNRIDIFVNGQLMSSGSGNDYSLPHTGSIKFTFNLILGDIVTIRTY